MIILTGGAGFIGSAFLWQLNLLGENNVIVVDALDSSEKWKNLRGHDFNDYWDRRTLLTRIAEDKLPAVRAIVHLGAETSTTETNADYLMENNYRFSRTLAEWAVKQGVRFVYASSAATYGDGSHGFSDDPRELTKLRPLNMYGYSKHIFDLWAERSGLSKSIVGLKFFNVFGPNEYHKENMASVVFKSFNQIRETGRIRLFKSYSNDYADGEQLRDFVYVKDCAKVINWFLTNPAANGLFNLGTGKARSWKDLATAVFSAVGKAPAIEYVEMPIELRDKYQYFTQASLSNLRRSGWNEPFMSLEDSVKDYVTSHLAKADPYL